MFLQARAVIVLVVTLLIYPDVERYAVPRER